MKKTVSLILAMVLSLGVFFADISGLVMVARAEDYSIESEPDGNYDSEYDYDSEYEEIIRRQEQEEAERQKAYEQAAKDAEEAARKQAEDEAAREAMRRSEEQENNDQDNPPEQEDIYDDWATNGYFLAAYLNSKQILSLDFGSAPMGVERDYYPIDIQNTGNTPVELIYSKTNDPDGAFSLTLHGDKLHLEPGETTRFYISVDSRLRPGYYYASIKFADAVKDPSGEKGFWLPVTATVTDKQPQISGVQVSPSRVTVAVGSTYQFSAQVQGTDSPSQDVRWSIVNQRSAGTNISSSGLLTMGSDETSSLISVIATSTANGLYSGTAEVTPQINSFNVSAAADPVNGGSVTGAGAVAQGGSVTLSAVPNRNYYFAGWFVDGNRVSTSTNYTISNVTSNKSVTARFAQNYVTVKAEPNNKDAGTVVGGGNITYGSSTTLSAKAYSGYVFTGWKEADTIISRDASISLNNLTTDRKITAIFAKTSYTISLATYPNEGGRVSGGGTFKMGSEATIKAEPADGYVFSEWQVNGQTVSRDASYRIKSVEQDYSCTAVFVKKGITTYEISAGVATTGGSISPSGRSTVAEGQSYTYTITPKAGYAILTVAVDGVIVGNVGSYTFTNVHEPHTIAVAFAQTQEAAAKAGVPQSNRVEPIVKTEANTATAESTVDINSAAAGEGGDSFVVEIEDLENIYVPTDEELGVEPQDDMAVSSNVAKFMGLSMDGLTQMVAQGDTVPIMNAAFYSGELGAYVKNDFEPKTSRHIDYNNMSREELVLMSEDDIYPSMPNLDTVVQSVLTTEDVVSMIQGNQINIAVSLTKEEPSYETGVIMKSAIGQTPVCYFDLSLFKTTNGDTERISRLSGPMGVVIEIPDDIYKKGKTYSVLRIHNGELSVLPDVDNDPKTITFYTDRFSSYAIAKQVTSAHNLVVWLCAGAALTFGIAMTSFVILIYHQRKMRRQRRKH